MASWLVRSSPDRSDPVSSPGACFSKVPGEKFSHTESRGIISNLMITELFYLHILSVTRRFFQIRFFRSVHRPVFRYRFTKNGFTGPKACGAFERTCPWSGTRSCVLRQGTLLSLCLSPPRSINGNGELLGEPKKLRGNNLRWTSIPSIGSRNTPSRLMPQKPG